ncbi:MAG TPA: SpoIID/LytB domain-containing protein [Thermaerobacter sp.]
MTDRARPGPGRPFLQPAAWTAATLTLIHVFLAALPDPGAGAGTPPAKPGAQAEAAPQSRQAPPARGEERLAPDLARRFRQEPVITVFDHSAVAVRSMPLEEYVAHVVAGEVVPTWSPDALRAQAVAARTYTIRLLLAGEDATPRRLYGTDTSTNPAEAQAFSERVPRSVREAVAATRGEILVYRGKPVVALFSACAAARTADLEESFPGDPRAAEAPYLRPVSSRCEEVAPADIRRWRAALTTAELAAIAGLEPGAVDRVRIARRGPSGRAVFIQIGPRRIYAAALRLRAGANRLKSTWITEIERGEGDVWIFHGRGWGHGVGLDQWGAEAMARDGRGYREILRHYYPGTGLVRLYR